jgi:hypothetical protein
MNSFFIAYLALLAASVFLGLWRYSGLQLAYKCYHALLFSTLFNECFVEFYLKPVKHSFGVYYNIYFLLSICLHFIFYLLQYQSGRVRFIAIAVFGLAMLYCFYSYSKGNLNTIHSDACITLAASLLVFGLLYFIDIFMHVTSAPLQTVPTFWVTLGMTIWSVVYIAYAGPLHYFVKSVPQLYQLAYRALNIVNILWYSLILYAIILAARANRTKSIAPAPNYTP